jgi:hypothetical protein
MSGTRLVPAWLQWTTPQLTVVPQHCFVLKAVLLNVSIIRQGEGVHMPQLVFFMALVQGVCGGISLPARLFSRQSRSDLARARDWRVLCEC